MGKKDPVEEARRYVDNAKTLLVEHGELDLETRSYTDRKYVKMAGDTHLVMGYDGAQSKATCDDGFHIANEIIDRCEVMLPKA